MPFTSCPHCNAYCPTPVDLGIHTRFRCLVLNPDRPAPMFELRSS